MDFLTTVTLTTSVCLQTPSVVMKALTLCTFIRLHRPSDEEVIFNHQDQENFDLKIGTTINGAFLEVSEKKKIKHRQKRETRNPKTFDSNDNHLKPDTVENAKNNISSFIYLIGTDPEQEEQDYQIGFENENTAEEADVSEELEDPGYVDGDYSEEAKFEILTSFFYFEPIISPNTWHYICVSYDHLNNQASCSIDGEFELLSSRHTETSYKAVNETDQIETELTCLGGDNFEGEIAATAMFNKYINFENTEINPCVNLTLDIEPSKLLNDFVGEFSNIEVYLTNMEEICDVKLQPLILYDSGMYTETDKQCTSLGGRLLQTSDITDDISLMLKGINNTCISDQVDKTVSWILTSDSFEKVQFHECKAVSSEGLIVNSACVKYLPCSICLIGNIRATLYGHDGSYFDHVFHLIVQQGQGIWEGKDRSTIIREGTNWKVSSPLHKTHLILFNKTVAIGRQDWIATNPENSLPDTLLTFSRCKTFQFSCNDGTCIDIKFRCDDVFHCEDFSDERSCNVVKLTPSYNEFYEPPPRPGETSPTDLVYDTKIYHMGPITTDEGKARLDIGITVSWYDPRLDFTNLKLEKKNFFNCSLVWKPSIRAITGKGDGSVLDTKTYEEQCYTIPRFQIPERSMTDPWMSHSASGLSYPLEYHIGLLASFPCGFYLSKYPFDSQKCNVSFMVMNAPGTKEFVKNTGVEIEYLNNNRVLLEYELQNLTTESNFSMQGLDNNTYFLVTIHLERLYGYHIMNSYFPSLLMSIISYSTFYFQINDFYDRILISLTSHFILASLFTAVTKNSTKTPYMKMIDVWYAIVMTYCFLVIILQVFINGILHCWHFPCCWDFCFASKNGNLLPDVKRSKLFKRSDRVKKLTSTMSTNEVEQHLPSCSGTSTTSDVKVAGRRNWGKVIKRSEMIDQKDDVDIEIIITDDSSEIVIEDNSHSEVNQRKFSKVVPMAKLLSVSAFLESTDTGKKLANQSAAKMNVNKMGPGVRAAECLNSLAKRMMLFSILGYLVTYFVLVQTDLV